jgi:hypothetical protein
MKTVLITQLHNIDNSNNANITNNKIETNKTKL